MTVLTPSPVFSTGGSCFKVFLLLYFYVFAVYVSAVSGGMKQKLLSVSSSPEALLRELPMSSSVRQEVGGLKQKLLSVSSGSEVLPRKFPLSIRPSAER